MSQNQSKKTPPPIPEGAKSRKTIVVKVPYPGWPNRWTLVFKEVN